MIVKIIEKLMKLEIDTEKLKELSVQLNRAKVLEANKK